MKKVTKQKSAVVLSGTVTDNGTPVSGATVTLLANGKMVGTATTNASGSFSKALSITKATAFQAKATVQQRDTACVTPLPATSVPGGCTGATVGAYTISSSTVAVKPKK